MALRQLVARARAHFTGDLRQLQRDLDTHRLFLLTSFYAAEKGEPGPGQPAAGLESWEALAHSIESQAKDLSPEEQAQAVQGNVHTQVVRALSIIHGILASKGAEKNCAKTSKGTNRPAPAANKTDPRSDKQRGLGAGAWDRALVEDPAPGLTAAEVSRQFQAQAGFMLRVASSKVAHPEAGLGLFLDGSARPGQVIAVYPGAVYPPSRYRLIPGYPQISRKNSFLVARFDGTIVDGEQWRWAGQGSGTRGDGVDTVTGRFWWGREPPSVPTRGSAGAAGRGDPLRRTKESGASSAEPGSLWLKSSDEVGGWGGGTSEFLGSLRTFVAGFGAEKVEVTTSDILARTGVMVDARNPLASAHIANHPGAKDKPNVMLCPYDFPSDEEPTLRPYIPNVVVGGEDVKLERSESWLWQGGSGMPVSMMSGNGAAAAKGNVVKTMLLVATRGLSNEELLLNYRLSPHVERPTWYTAVDGDEDNRRWA